MSDRGSRVAPEWLRTMPKVELHVHLEGTLSPETHWTLAGKHGIDPGVQDRSGVACLYEYRDFTHFIDMFTSLSDTLRCAEDLEMAVEAYGCELARQHVRDAELHFNPEPHRRKRGIAMPDALAAMNGARKRVRARHGIEMRWIADGSRDADSGPISVDHTVDWMIDPGHESGIVALGLGGQEHGHPRGISRRRSHGPVSPGFTSSPTPARRPAPKRSAKRSTTWAWNGSVTGSPP